MRSKKLLVIGLIVPTIVLLGIAVKSQYQYNTGTEVELPISGYDPRDLLSGYYITYTVDYGIETCTGEPKQYDAYVCLNPKEFSIPKPESCNLLINGTCRNGRFEAGVERFYASEENAKQLDKIIREKPMSIVLSVSNNGKAQVKYLVVDGKRWQEK